jgi:hypothetical protein
VAETRLSQRAGYFSAGKRNKPIPSRGPLQVLSTQGVGNVYVDGVLMGTTPYIATVSEGEYRVEVRWVADPYSKAFSQSATVLAGTGVKIAAVKGPSYTIGDTGPAGGIIFYDKGKATEGWRFLEAAPNDQSVGVQWYNGNYIDIKASVATAIGTGKANTAAIIAAQGTGSYAAAPCDSLVIGDYDDWFLPSKDELNLMYTNLKKAGLGGFGGAWLWSSSQDDYYYVWVQYFSDGKQFYYKDYNLSVRACRAF